MGFWKELFGVPDGHVIEAAAHQVQLETPLPTNNSSPLQTVAWNGLIGDDILAALPPNRAEALSISSVVRGRVLICGFIARCPMLAYDDDGKPLATQPEWLTHTSGMLSPFNRMMMTVDDLIFYGFSLWHVVRSKFDKSVIAAARVPYENWSFSNDGTQILIGTGADAKPAREDEYILIPGIHEGILAIGARTIRQYANLLKAADKAAATPNAYLELHNTGDNELSREDVEQLISDWVDARRGLYGGVAYTNGAIELREHGAADSHLLIEGRNAAAVDVARLMGIPAALIDAQAQVGGLTYETTQSRNAEFLDYGLAPYMEAIVSRLSQDDVSPHGVKIGFDILQMLKSLPLSVKTDDERIPDLPVPSSATPSSKAPVPNPPKVGK